MHKKLVILGTAGNSIDILDIIEDINHREHRVVYECIGFLDDNPSLQGKKICDLKVLGQLRTAGQFSDCYFVNGIGSPNNFSRKEAIIAGTGIKPDRFATIIHPSASISRTARIGHGTVVFYNVAIASNVTIGNHVIILSNSVVNHNAFISDYSSITSGVCISGGTVIGTASYLGSNCSVIGNIKIGAYCMVGMGSVVLDNVTDNSVVVGNPARFLRHTTS